MRLRYAAVTPSFCFPKTSSSDGFGDCAPNSLNLILQFLIVQLLIWHHLLIQGPFVLFSFFEQFLFFKRKPPFLFGNVIMIVTPHDVQRLGSKLLIAFWSNQSDVIGNTIINGVTRTQFVRRGQENQSLHASYWPTNYENTIYSFWKPQNGPERQLGKPGLAQTSLEARVS